MEHQDTATVEKEIRGVGNNSLRELYEHILSELCPPLQAEIHNDDRGTGNGCPVVSEVPRDGGTQRTRGYVRDDNRDHYTPSKFGIKLCQMWIDAIGTPDEQWYLTGYDLYIDRVIFNPNI